MGPGSLAIARCGGLFGPGNLAIVSRSRGLGPRNMAWCYFLVLAPESLATDCSSGVLGSGTLIVGLKCWALERWPLMLSGVLGLGRVAADCWSNVLGPGSPQCSQ